MHKKWPKRPCHGKEKLQILRGKREIPLRGVFTPHFGKYHWVTEFRQAPLTSGGQYHQVLVAVKNVGSYGSHYDLLKFFTY